MTQPSILYLTGFSGSGKSAVAPIVAQRLGWALVDTDALVEARAGKPILDIFRDEGEEHFRMLEREVMAELASRKKVVVSSGGGIILQPENRRVMADGGFIVCLEARPETILRRLTERAGEEPLDRPLLRTTDPLSRIRELKEARQHLYALCDYAVHTDLLAEEEVAEAVIDAFQRFAGRAAADAGRAEAVAAPRLRTAPLTLHAFPQDAAAIVTTSGGQYPVFVELGGLARLGERLREAGLARFAYVISDEAVAHHYEDEASEALRKAEVPFALYTMPPGEENKTLRTASHVYDWLIERRAERGHTIVALGGGVVTDLAGYVAATFARGLPLVHVPTTVLAMVDAAIGGKVGVNHPRAKNMIGAFHQPRMVLADPATLRTLPPRELSGWAEAIKHGLIADESYLRFLEDNAERILRLEPEATAEAIGRSAAIKAGIVSRDEREEREIRTVLNYGHTLAHAVESATGYARFRHGEADGIGMTAAALISEQMGLLSHDAAARQQGVLQRYKLPAHAEGLDRGVIKSAMALDKKIQGRALRWVLLEDIGKPVVRDDVPADIVETALNEVLR